MAGPHHEGPYRWNAKRVRDAANANPATICWRCQRTLDEHPHARDGTRPRWTAGHTIDGDPAARPWLDVTRRPPAGSWLAPEASCCNYAAGAGRRNRWAGNPRSETWFAT